MPPGACDAAASPWRTPLQVDLKPRPPDNVERIGRETFDIRLDELHGRVVEDGYNGCIVQQPLLRRAQQAVPLAGIQNVPRLFEEPVVLAVLPACQVVRVPCLKDRQEFNRSWQIRQP